MQEKGPPPPTPVKKSSVKGRSAQLSRVNEEPGGKEESTVEKKPVGKFTAPQKQN